MKILKYLLLSILGLIVLLLILAAIMPKTFEAKSSIVVNKPKSEVYDYIKYLSNQQHYGEWYRMDDQIEITSNGTDATEGFELSWKSKKVGDGRQVITNITEGERVDSDIYFDGSDDAANSYIAVKEINPSQTEVEWAIKGEMPYPFNLATLVYDMSDDFKKGLNNLKEILERQ